ncbi:MAG: rod shape-determining protein MreC [Flavobacteriaceae bacterium]|jgi:rod shape-determining protein MreC|nr:rod shape-determining protein MreC [Flavobacteriaceae bacterium]MDG2498430.1 rod shape-determining protein MreC [Flavobacteriaceae bacterium]
MQQLFNFFIKNKTFVLFLLLFSYALSLTIQSHEYHRSKFLNSSNQITGSVYGTFHSITQYFNLKQENRLLLEENNRLKTKVFNQKDSIPVDSVLEYKYDLFPSLVYKNSYALPNNYLTLNKGKNDSIKEDYGVITSKGIVGIIDATSKNYSRVLSVLNTNSRVNVKLKKTNYFGTLSWDGKSPEITQLKDIQDLVKLSVGDTVVTSGYSSTFPPNIPVGSVESFDLNDTKDLYIIDVKLFNNMKNLEHVYIIKNTDINELKTLIISNE